LILLDTNVISEAMRPRPEAKLVAWLDAQATETLHLSTITVAELMFGVAALPDGHRKRELGESLDRLILPLFEGRILSFDLAAAQAYATIRARARARGQAIATADGFIAAIAFANNLTVATRDTGPFEAAQVPLVNPWTE
jgi:predicted nucleic acid-binding protein